MFKKDEIFYVKINIGIAGNENVDRLACLTDGIPHSLDLTPNEIRSIIKKIIYRNWQNLWSTFSMVKGRHFWYAMLRIPRKSPSY